MADCSLDGKLLSTRTERLHGYLSFQLLAGELPMELGNLINLTRFYAYGNSLPGALSIRTERLVVFG